ncbi:FUSC family protein [Rhodococcus qingshengii]|uniref:FUSC family protein n=1 Tax=Rhodococcus qingshengii TaxID=334542 RepID=UPI0024BB9F83|nr:FUSC family protein [Rhodococcus qingshengii]MDJ0491312.1 FUSC family protein [Rhodococcus qingshengii]
MSTHRMSVVRWLSGLLLCFVPMVCLYLSSWSPSASFVYLGLLPALVALERGVRLAAVTAVLTPISVFLGLMISGSAWISAVFVAAICIGVAWSYTKGWQGAATYIASQGALAAIAAPGARLTDMAPNSLVSAAVVTGFVLVGGVWVVLMGVLLLDDLPHNAHEQPADEDLRRFTIMLICLVFFGTLAAKLWLPGGHAWWVVLTILVVLQPGVAGTSSRTLHRVLGTVAGGFLAALLVYTIGINSVTTAIGVFVAILSGIAYLKAPYWVFAALLTAALMCLSFTPETVIHGYAERAGFTLLAATATVAVLKVSEMVLKPVENKRI